MAGYIGGMRKAYIDQLIANGDFDRANEIANQDNIYTPILKTRDVHQDEEPDPKDYNEMICDLVYDLSILNVEFCTMGYSFNELILDTNNRLKAVRKALRAEQERQQDINMLCNKYTEFSQTINLTGDDFTGNFSETDGIFTANITNLNNVDIQVTAVEGNGYEGNKYVYKDKDFLEKTISTASRKYITDGAEIPLYEYSRITADNTEKDIFPLVNFDSIEAKCSITLYSQSKFNKLIIESPQTDIVLSDISISDDGVIFENVNKENIEFNNTDKKYETINYIPGSGIVCFPSTFFVKITLESRSTTDDIIAFMKSVIVK